MASKTIFLKRDIIFRFARHMAPIYKWSNRKIQDSPFTQVTFLNTCLNNNKKTPKTFQAGIIFLFSPSTRKTPTQVSITNITFCSYKTKFKKKKKRKKLLPSAWPSRHKKRKKLTTLLFSTDHVVHKKIFITITKRKWKKLTNLLFSTDHVVHKKIFITITKRKWKKLTNLLFSTDHVVQNIYYNNKKKRKNK